MRLCIKIDSASGHRYLAVTETGKPVLANPLTNKSTAFTKRERRELRIMGLLPPIVSTMKQQLERTYENFSAKPTDLDKFVYLAGLHDRNETLFYRLVYEHIDEMMPIVYTPVVGEACQKFSHIYRHPRGLYVSYEHRGEIETVLRNANIDRPSVIVVTDGERILGLGDQGTGGMGIPIGKLCLYTLCAGLSPMSTLPIMLDVGTDNEERLADPLYLGLRHKRIRGEQYQTFIDEFVATVNKVFPDVVLQWEDFLKGNAIHQLRRFRNELCTFNDDIQGTAAVVLSGLYAAMRITQRNMADQRVVIAGAGASAQGIADLIVAALVEAGLTREEATRRIWTLDSRGLVTHARSNLEEFKATYARSVDELERWICADRTRATLVETIRNVEPTILIGTSGTPGTFTREVVAAMTEINAHPIIFPLSNPTSKSECTAQDALSWSAGRAIVATGSPFPNVTLNGRTYRIGQCNNAFIFPGVGLGLAACRARRVTDGMFLDAAKALAAQVSDEDLAAHAVYPRLTRIRECSHAVACATVRRAVTEDLADPDILENLEETLKSAMWFPEYLPVRYEP